MIIGGATESQFNRLGVESKSGPKLGLHLHHSDETDSTGGGIRSSVSSKVQKYIKDLNGDRDVRKWAALALGRIGKEKPSEVIEALIRTIEQMK
ncbi:MAG: hypothetical protein HYY52_05945 [Candidatus Melainabacteria bacterium]|nr:hypothetical protein [Candidatus Melainabacteria bacterium]